MAKKKITPSELHMFLKYEPETGVLTWVPRTGKWSSRWNSRYAGKQAGYMDAHGYRAVKLLDRAYLAHRVAWAMTHGEWPECVDHLNGNRSDNRLANLRSVSRKMNQRNQKMHSTNTSGRTGVCWAKKSQKWIATIKVDGRQTHLGYYENFDDAVIAREAAEQKYGFTGRL